MASHFVKHEPCPKCKSRDNLGVWSDGHQWCFGCGYYLPAQRTLENMRAQLEKSPHVTPNSPDFTRDIPIKAIKWLKSYGITDDEISRYCRGYTRDDYLCFSVTDSYLVGRNFGKPENPRYLGMGTRPSHQVHIGCPSDIGIFVEDMVSAIKVGRQYTAIPIFGSSIGELALLEAAGAFKNVGVWLDSNMVRRASRIAQKGPLLTGCNVFRVYTPLDPKCYNNIEINMIVEEAKNGRGYCGKIGEKSSN